MPYCEVTRNIRVEVEPTYEAQHSRPEENYYVFSYRIRITNESDATAQLLSRHWIITDGHGKVHEVKGEGVVGQQPRLRPQEVYEYSSFCPLPTPTGNMRGSYLMVDEETQQKFEIKIPLFFLRDLRNFH